MKGQKKPVTLQPSQEYVSEHRRQHREFLHRLNKSLTESFGAVRKDIENLTKRFDTFEANYVSVATYNKSVQQINTLKKELAKVKTELKYNKDEYKEYKKMFTEKYDFKKEIYTIKRQLATLKAGVKKAQRTEVIEKTIVQKKELDKKLVEKIEEIDHINWNINYLRKEVGKLMAVDKDNEAPVDNMQFIKSVSEIHSKLIVFRQELDELASMITDRTRGNEADKEAVKQLVKDAQSVKKEITRDNKDFEKQLLAKVDQKTDKSNFLTRKDLEKELVALTSKMAALKEEMDDITKDVNAIKK